MFFMIESRRTRKTSRPCSAILNAEIWDFWSATDLRSALTSENPPATMIVSTMIIRTATGIANPRRSVLFSIYGQASRLVCAVLEENRGDERCALVRRQSGGDR